MTMRRRALSRLMLEETLEARMSASHLQRDGMWSLPWAQGRTVRVRRVAAVAKETSKDGDVCRVATTFGIFFPRPAPSPSSYKIWVHEATETSSLSAERAVNMPVEGSLVE